MSIQVRCNLIKLKLNKDQLLKDVDTQMEEALHEGAKSFCRVAMPKIPVWSGMARGSVSALADWLGLHYATIVPVIYKRNKRKADPRVINRVDEGKTMVSEEPYIFKKGKEWIFRFSSKVDHLEYLDINAGRSPTAPWHSFDAGLRAMANKVREYIKGHPIDMGKYFVRHSNHTVEEE